MGLFDFLSRKPKQDGPEGQAVGPPPAAPAPVAPDPRLSPFQQSLWQAERAPGFAWKDDNEPARAFVRSLLHYAAPTFGNGLLVDGEPAKFLTPASLVNQRFGNGVVHEQDRNPELRGAWEGIPMRIPISIPAKKIWAIEMRCEEKRRFFSIHRDLSRIPAAERASDPWSKSEQPCVFLGKGIFLDDSDPETTRQWLLPAWATVPVVAQELVVREMERLDLRYFELSNGDRTLLVLGNRTLSQLEDPIAFVASCATFMAEFVKALASSAGTTAVGVTPVRCAYCVSLFVLTASKNTCPNCGAPAT